MRILPLTPGQAVYHDFIVAPATCTPAKRLFAAYIVDARLDAGRLEAAIDRVVALHDSLRTAVEPVHGVPAQVIREPAAITEPAVRQVAWDGSPHGAAEHIGALDDWWSVPRPLALQVVAGTGPGDRTLLACVLNHACSDGISAELIFDQIRAEYDGTTIKPDSVEQFASYYARVLDEGLHETLDDWTRLLDQGSPALPDRMVEEKLTTAEVSIRLHSWAFAARSVQALASVAQERACTQFEVLAACTGLYFRREDGRPASFGVIHSGRHGFRGFDVHGLLRSYVVDVVDHAGTPTIGQAVERRRDQLRSRLEHFARLPFEEACVRTGRSPGWRAGQLGAWEVELNGMYPAAPDMTMHQARVHVADVPVPEEATCENGGPTLLVSFTLGSHDVGASLRFVSPPIDARLASLIAEDLEATARFACDHLDAPVSDAPAFFRRT
jgi:hypothetical protein